jgi:hypothetical protein
MLLSPHNPVPMPGISRRECSEEISESDHFGADSPRAIGMKHA